MSLDTEIAQLTGSANALIDTFNNKKAEIDTALSDALKAFPNLEREFFIDQVNGDDSNAGDEQNPLKSVQAAAERCGRGTFLRAILLSDYRFKTKEEITSIHLFLGSKSSADKKTVSFDLWTDNGKLFCGGLATRAFSQVELYALRIEMPDISGYTEPLDIGFDYLFGSTYSSDTSLMTYKMTYMEFVPPTETIPLIETTAALLGMVLFSCSYTASMNGKWVRGISAGTSVSSVEYIIANGITSL